MTERDKEIYMFNIVTEAKVRAMVAMTKKYHPTWTKKQIENFLKGSIEYAVKKELGSNE